MSDLEPEWEGDAGLDSDFPIDEDEEKESPYRKQEEIPCPTCLKRTKWANFLDTYIPLMFFGSFIIILIFTIPYCNQYQLNEANAERNLCIDKLRELKVETDSDKKR